MPLSRNNAFETADPTDGRGYLEAGPAIRNAFPHAPFSAFHPGPSLGFNAFIRVDLCNPWLNQSELIRLSRIHSITTTYLPTEYTEQQKDEIKRAGRSVRCGRCADFSLRMSGWTRMIGV